MDYRYFYRNFRQILHTHDVIDYYLGSRRFCATAMHARNTDSNENFFCKKNAKNNLRELFHPSELIILEQRSNKEITVQNWDISKLRGKAIWFAFFSEHCEVIRYI